MPNIATVLRDEVARLSRREVRSQVDPARKAVTRQRRELATLKRQVGALARQVAQLARAMAAMKSGTAAATATTATPRRVSAKGLHSQRNRLALSASDFGRLVGVSAQTIYGWERATTHPRSEQLARLAALRGIGKREAARRLEQLGTAGKKPPRKT